MKPLKGKAFQRRSNVLCSCMICALYESIKMYLTIQRDHRRFGCIISTRPKVDDINEDIKASPECNSYPDCIQNHIPIIVITNGG